MPDDFGKWWNCLKKHHKRLEYWLPHAQTISEQIDPPRPLRYFTLCARTMIDVFMLARQSILSHDEDYGHVSDVVFCEFNEEHFPEITEMLGVEGSGFLQKLEDLVLFRDDDYTSQFPEVEHIQVEIEREGESLPTKRRDRLSLKSQHILFSNKFPRDFLNLDFCGLYYPEPPPPGVFKINEAVEKIISLQGRTGADEYGTPVIINQFVLTVTCRFDNTVPEEAFARLENLVRQNQNDDARYLEAVRTLKGTDDPSNWRASDRYDFFLSSWPKEMLRVARREGWLMEVVDYLHYGRPADSSGPYNIVCLVARFTRNNTPPSYLSEAIRVLDEETRIFINEIDRDSITGRNLLTDLQAVVDVRNQRARVVGRPELPSP